MIDLTTIAADDWVRDEAADSTVFTFDGTQLDTSEFLAIRNQAWGDAPHAELLERHGVIGYLPRGAGNADTYMYVLGHDDQGDLAVALVDNAALPG